MATFTWRDEITVSVGEMSRAQALDCARQFEIATQFAISLPELMAETDVLGVLNAPAVVQHKSQVIDAGTRTITLADGECISLTLPMTRECFSALPISLTRQWITAMVKSNEWLVDDLKKLLSLATEKISEPQSGSAPSTEPTREVKTIKTTGE